MGDYDRVVGGRFFSVTDSLSLPKILEQKYRISSVIRHSFFSFQNSPKILDPS